MFQVDRVWIDFMESPVAALEDYGLSLRAINCIEENFGIYIKYIRYADEAELAKTMNLGVKQRKSLKIALEQYYSDLKRGRNGL